MGMTATCITLRITHFTYHQTCPTQEILVSVGIKFDHRMSIAHIEGRLTAQILELVAVPLLQGNKIFQQDITCLMLHGKILTTGQDLTSIPDLQTLQV
ncbi:hypothetical protein TNCV_4510371 [Trichonephila clavipes]|nr:hypothetical protein TNCV_4510371 [Trichonephila clavipes]